MILHDKGYYGNIEDFWSKDLKNFLFDEISPVAPRDYYHKNWKEPGVFLHQSFNEDLPSCWKMFYDALNVVEGSVCWLSLEPNQVIPVHQDFFFVLRQKHSCDIDKCVRYLIMLENYKYGHIVYLDDIVLTNWKKGDVWYFDSTVKHFAANASQENFYSCQVSTLK